jgi:paraquat-inducible protein B
MNTVLLNERNIKSIKDQKDMMSPVGLKINLISKDYISLKANLNMLEFDKATLTTHKSSINSQNHFFEKEAPLSERINMLEFEKIDEEEIKPNIRKDIFGREIKKGGKHKISFADDLDIIKSLLPERKNVIEHKSSHKINEIITKKNSPSKNSELALPEIKTIKRANSFTEGRISMMKNVYNISKIKTKKFKKFNVEVINIENMKKETKLNTFAVKNRVAAAEEENVSCSCYCSIW